MPVSLAWPSLSSRSGLLVSYCGEVCRHAEGQGAAASAAAAGAADAAAQQRHHLGEPDGPGRPHPAVSRSKETAVAAAAAAALSAAKLARNPEILCPSSGSLPAFVLLFASTGYCSPPPPLVLRNRGLGIRSEAAKSQQCSQSVNKGS